MVQSNYADVLRGAKNKRVDDGFLNSVNDALRRILQRPDMVDIRTAAPRGVETGHGGQVVHTCTF